MSVKPKRVLAGRYELNDRLGSGGMAEVYLGKDRVLGREVAVKILLPQFAGDPHFIARFRREAQSAAALNHPHIVGVYDTGSDDGTHFIVMEYIEGKTLRDLIRDEGPLLPERAAELGGDVCSALGFAHSHGIVHRDVKPANIMLTKAGAVKVTDFGIARAASSETVTQTATVLGTAQYFSPEQAQAGPVDARSDIYSLGVVLYEMVTRQVPFTGSSPVAIAYKHVKEDPIPPSRLNADVPPSIESIVMKALAKNPDNRYQGAGEMRQDLMRAAAGKPVHATPVMAPVEQTSIAGAPVASDQTVVIRRTGPAQDAIAKRRRLGWFLLTLIMLAIGGVVAWAIVQSLPKTPSTATVPSVTGQSLEDAQAALRRAGFDPVVVNRADATVPDGQVINTDPPGGQTARRGSDVKVFVSTGPGIAVVPDLKGKTQDEAAQALTAVGLQIGNVGRAPSSAADKDRVISQNPTANRRVDRTEKVDIVLGSGPEMAPVPTVIGMREADAVAAIQAAGFRPVVENRDVGPTCFVAPGRVCDQDPDGGQVREKNSTVTIYVADGGGGDGSPSPTPTETGGD